MILHHILRLCWVMMVMILFFIVIVASSVTAFTMRERMMINHQHSKMFQSDQSNNNECPFSKAFPRYRIDLTRIGRKEESNGWFSQQVRNPFEIVSKTIQKSKLERVCDPGEALYWAPEVDGVAAMSLLWDRASSLVESPASNSEIIALPDASKQLVLNWAEIVDWGDFRMLQVSLLTEEITDLNIPAIRISSSSDKTSNNSILPTTNTNVQVLKERTQAWVKRILVEQGICPFTKSVKRSGQGLGDLGVPVGGIAYHGSGANHPITLFRDTWEAILEMIEAGPSGKEGISSILLAAPNFDDDFDFWAGPVFAMLEASVVAAEAQEQIGVVCFHPRYATPDGKSWPGFGHMHSVPRLEKWYMEHSERKDLTSEEVAAGGAWQRRTPHATINVLRADQLEKAESRRMSGSMYTKNIEKLVCEIGSNKLAEDLEKERSLGI